VAGDEPSRSAASVSHDAQVGLSYEPLRRLSPLLDLYYVFVLGEDVWPEMSDEEEEEPSRYGLRAMPSVRRTGWLR
jgi:hypothetical protein